MALLVETWANLISLFVISTPTISSPCTEDFPIFDLKKSPIFFEKTFFCNEAFVSEPFFPKLGFLNLIFFKLSRKLNFVFLSSWFSFKFWFTSTGSFFSGCIVVWFWTGVPWTSVDWSVEV